MVVPDAPGNLRTPVAGHADRGAYMTAEQIAVTNVLNQLWHRWHQTPDGKSGFCDAILDLFQLGNEHRFTVNAYAFKDMKDKLIDHIVKHGELAR